MDRRSGTKQPEHRRAPEPEGPEEISRRFQKMNRSGALGSLRDLAGGLGRKSLYGTLVVIASIAAFALDLLLDVPLMDFVAVTLAGALVTLLVNKEDEQISPDEDGFFERLLKRLGDPLDDPEDDPHRTGER